MGIKVSVIMPSFNVAPYIRECMDSVISQTLEDIEIIVVDADSTDGTREILDEYSEKDNRIRLLRDDKKSTGYANNKAIDIARGEYIGIVETDDYIVPTMYERLYEAAKANDCDVVKGDYWSFSGEGDDRMYIKRNLWMDIKGKYEKVLNPQDEDFIFDAIMFNWAGIYRRDFLNEYHIRHKETPGASFQDNGFYFQTLAFAKRVYFVKEAFYRYRRDNPNSSINNPNKVFCMCDEYDFIESILKKYPELWNKYYIGYLRRRYGACSWTLKKVLTEYRYSLANRIQKDFHRLLREDVDIARIQREDRYRREFQLMYEDTNKYLDFLFERQEDYGKKAVALRDRIGSRGIFIFGCGECGSSMDCLLESLGADVRGFIDNDISLQGTEFNHKLVLSLEDAIKRYPDACYLSTVQNHWDDVREQLMKAAITRNRIIDIDIKDYIWD